MLCINANITCAADDSPSTSALHIVPCSSCLGVHLQAHEAKRRVVEQAMDRASEGRDGGKTAGPRSAVLAKMDKRLHGGRFRMLNERLYTATSAEAFELMKVRMRHSLSQVPARPRSVSTCWHRAGSCHVRRLGQGQCAAGHVFLPCLMF
jgi:Hypothetical methyltransferase